MYNVLYSIFDEIINCSLVPCGDRFANKVLTRFINMQSLESSAPVNCLDPVCTVGADVDILSGSRLILNGFS